LEAFTQFLVDRGVRRYLEIGARHGDTFHHIMNALPEASFGLAVDLPGALWGKSGSDSALYAAVTDIMQHGSAAAMLLGDSKLQKTLKMVEFFGPFDAVLIDGDHSLEGVRSDWKMYGPLAPIVAFHDIVGDGVVDKRSKRAVEVPLLWRELQSSQKTREFVDTDSKMGIGVICK
jgi:hypothetical protein